MATCSKTPSQLMWEVFSHATTTMQKLLVYKYPLVSRARYSHTQL